MLAALRTISEGVARAHVLARLGRPAYSISASDGGRYVERCRFRIALEDIASIEFRDGLVSKIDIVAR
jgi:hypothetical protein